MGIKGAGPIKRRRFWKSGLGEIVSAKVRSSPDQATGPIWLFLLSHNLRSTTILTLRCCQELSTHQLAASSMLFGCQYRHWPK